MSNLKKPLLREASSFEQYEERVNQWTNQQIEEIEDKVGKISEGKGFKKTLKLEMNRVEYLEKAKTFFKQRTRHSTQFSPLFMFAQQAARI